MFMCSDSEWNGEWPRLSSDSRYDTGVVVERMQEIHSFPSLN